MDNQACPAQWSSDTGDSSVPPATVGADITVIVTSSATQTGSVVSGNVVELVTVQTDPGYADDPGHPGWGTVVGVVSCGGGGTSE